MGGSDGLGQNVWFGFAKIMSKTSIFFKKSNGVIARIILSNYNII